MTPSTTLAPNAPWPYYPTPKPTMPKPSPLPTAPRKKTGVVDVDKLVIERNVQPPGARVAANKYAEKFKTMEIGISNIRCKPAETGSICNALRSWIEQHKLQARVRGVPKCDDGYGRVWMLALDNTKTK